MERTWASWAAFMSWLSSNGIAAPYVVHRALSNAELIRVVSKRGFWRICTEMSEDEFLRYARMLDAEQRLGGIL